MLVSKNPEFRNYFLLIDRFGFCQRKFVNQDVDLVKKFLNIIAFVRSQREESLADKQLGRGGFLTIHALQLIQGLLGGAN